MSLMDFVVPKTTVTFGAASVDVRGVALDDITFIFRDHLVEVNRLMALYDDEEKRNTVMAQAAKFAVHLISEAPELCHTLIARCADEAVTPEVIKHVSTFPVGLQVELVNAIWTLTVEEAGGAKKLLDKFMGLVTQVRPSSLSGG
jgi:hypothetical protein